MELDIIVLHYQCIQILQVQQVYIDVFQNIYFCCSTVEKIFWLDQETPMVRDSFQTIQKHFKFITDNDFKY